MLGETFDNSDLIASYLKETTSYAFDLSASVKDYEYTKRSVVNLKRIINSKQFERADSETIFQYLQKKAELVYFGDFLKRYIYEISTESRAFSEVPDEFYITVIAESFEMNRAPHSFAPVSSKWRNIIKRWLQERSAGRNTVFLLGFGLGMTDTDVSMFLMKVLKEQDFRFDDPRETAFWYCFHHALPYTYAMMLLDETQHPEDILVHEPRFWEYTGKSLQVYLSNEAILREYLAWLYTQPQRSREAIRSEFQELYSRATRIAKNTNKKGDLVEENNERNTGAYAIESILYSGIPRTKSRNLIAASRSLLSEQFGRMRLDRHRLGQILQSQLEPDRFDLLTLLFFNCVMEDPDLQQPAANGNKERFDRFIEEANRVLTRCGLWEVYPVNPYESFLLMCLLTEDPLCAFNDVLEISYD